MEGIEAEFKLSCTVSIWKKFLPFKSGRIFFNDGILSVFENDKCLVEGLVIDQYKEKGIFI